MKSPLEAGTSAPFDFQCPGPRLAGKVQDEIDFRARRTAEKTRPTATRQVRDPVFDKVKPGSSTVAKRPARLSLLCRSSSIDAEPSNRKRPHLSPLMSALVDPTPQHRKNFGQTLDLVQNHQSSRVALQIVDLRRVVNLVPASWGIAHSCKLTRHFFSSAPQATE